MLPTSSLNENAKKWVRALRSGLFKQGEGFLRSDDNTNKDNYLCCLGVACELAIADGLKISRHRNASGNYSYGDSIFTGLLPPEVQDWLGLRTNDGQFDDAIYSSVDYDEYCWTTLTELNDSAGYDFDMIADFVESNPKGLFKRDILDATS